MHHCLDPFFMFELLTLWCALAIVALKAGPRSCSLFAGFFSAFYSKERINTVANIFPKLLPLWLDALGKCTYTNIDSQLKPASFCFRDSVVLRASGSTDLIFSVIFYEADDAHCIHRALQPPDPSTNCCRASLCSQLRQCNFELPTGYGKIDWNEDSKFGTLLWIKEEMNCHLAKYNRWILHVFEYLQIGSDDIHMQWGWILLLEDWDYK